MMDVFKIMLGVAVAYVVGVGGIIAIANLTMTDPVTVVTEDSPGWDCLRQGNRTCRIDGVLVTSIDDIPTDPYDRCVYLLGISERVGGIDYTDTACADSGVNR